KKKMSLLQDKFNDYVNEKGYKLERGERAIETERKHVDVSNFKQQTEYHKSELEQVQRDFDATLEKWDKARQLNLQHEKDEVAPIIARNTGESILLKPEWYLNFTIPKKLYGHDVLGLTLQYTTLPEFPATILARPPGPFTEESGIISFSFTSKLSSSTTLSGWLKIASEISVSFPKLSTVISSS